MHSTSSVSVRSSKFTQILSLVNNDPPKGYRHLRTLHETEPRQFRTFVDAFRDELWRSPVATRRLSRKEVTDLVLGAADRVLGAKH